MSNDTWQIVEMIRDEAGLVSDAPDIGIDNSVMVVEGSSNMWIDVEEGMDPEGLANAVEVAIIDLK